MKSVSFSAVFCLIALVLSGAYGQDLEYYISDTCFSIGVQFPTTCKAELDKAQDFFGIQLSNLESVGEVDITADDVNSFVDLLSEVPVTDTCCEAMCQFQNELCGCNDTLMQLVEGFLGDLSVVNTVMEAVSQNCKQMPVYFGETCPTEEEAAILEPTECSQYIEN